MKATIAVAALVSVAAMADTPSPAPTTGVPVINGKPYTALPGDVMNILSGADLYDRCTVFLDITRGSPVGPTDRLVKAVACLSYINGYRNGAESTAVIDAMREPGATPNTANYPKFSAFCVPVSTTNGALTTAAIDYLDVHPEKKTTPAPIVLMFAWRALYPCPKAN